MPVNPNLPIAKGTPFREILENFEYMLKALQSFAERIWGRNESIRVDCIRPTAHFYFLFTSYLCKGTSPLFFSPGSHQSTGAQLGGRSIPISADTSGHGAWGGAQKIRKRRKRVFQSGEPQRCVISVWLDEDDNTSRLYCNVLYEFII